MTSSFATLLRGRRPSGQGARTRLPRGRPWIRARSVKALGPNMLSIFHLDELRHDSKLVAVLTHAAFHHVADAQFFSDPLIDSLGRQIQRPVRAALSSACEVPLENFSLWQMPRRDAEGQPIMGLAQDLVGRIKPWQTSLSLMVQAVPVL